ncbi:MAG: proton-conducting transporter membrane subunit [Bacteroidales bacterium]|nr:proton-conducting transporter membrane subunit [Bacteroidales bacterium]MDD4821679.1 proton-conducting transporter membrane subunit [Bacteroidales bacterium]
MILIYLLSVLLIGTLLFFNRGKVLNYPLVCLFLFVQCAFTVYACLHYNESSSHYFTFDSLGIIMLCTATVISIPASYYSYIYVEDSQVKPDSKAIYWGAFTLLIAAVSASFLANHIAVMWIFTEITTLSASALIYHHRNKLALEGTWKYVFICAVSITFVYIGILFLSLSMEGAGSTDLSYKNLLANSSLIDPLWLRFAFLFVFTGFTAKLGLFPMFTAGVDAKDKAPGPAAALFSSIVMCMGFVGIFRTYILVANTSLHHWASLVVGIAAFLSLFIAAVYMIKVKNIKRMMAYSSVEHMGLVMLGIAAGGIGYYAAILHIVLHSFVKSSLFFQYNQLYKTFGTKDIYQMGNYFKYNTTGAIVILLAVISVTAMPPSGLFVSELLIFRSLFEANHLIVLIVVLLLLTLIIWSQAKNFFKILYSPVVGFDETNVPRIPSHRSAFQFVLLAGAAYLGLNPPAIFVEMINDCIRYLP